LQHVSIKSSLFSRIIQTSIIIPQKGSRLPEDVMSLRLVTYGAEDNFKVNHTALLGNFNSMKGQQTKPAASQR